MSAAIDALLAQSEVHFQEVGFKRACKVMDGADSGKTFFGIIDDLGGSFDLETALGIDRREKSILSVPNAEAPNFESGNKFSCDGTVWKVVQRMSNPISPTVTWEIQIVTAKDT